MQDTDGTAAARRGQRAGLCLTLAVAFWPPGAVAQSAGTATITGPGRAVDGDGVKIGPVAIRVFGKIISRFF